MRSACVIASIVAAGLLATSSVSQADVIATPPQDFNSTTAGAVPSGWSTPSDTYGSGQTVASVGVGATNGFQYGTTGNGSIINLSYSTTLNLVTGSPTYDFSLAFYLLGPPTTGSGFIAAGLEDTTGVAGQPFSAGATDRTSVGIYYNSSAGAYGMGSEGQMNQYSNEPISSSTFSLTSDHWYLLSGSIAYTGGTTPTWDYSNLSVQDLGTTGTSSPGSNILPSADQSDTVKDDVDDGSNITPSAAYFFVGTWNEAAGEGVQTIDNIDDVPEPASLGVICLCGAAFLRRPRRGLTRRALPQ